MKENIYYNNKKPDYIYESNTSDASVKNSPYFIKRKYYRVYYPKKILLFIVFICIIAVFFIVFYNLFMASKYVTTNQKEYYFVCLNSISDLDALNETKEYITGKGGAGYVINDGEFVVVVCGYQSYDDALLVSQNLTNIGYNIDILTYVVESYSIKIDTQSDEYYDNEKINVKNLVSELLAYPFDLFDDIYRLSVSLDVGELTQSYVLSVIAQYYQAIKTSLEPLENLSDYSTIYDFYSVIMSNLNNILQCESFIELCSALKYVNCDLLVSYNSYVSSI